MPNIGCGSRIKEAKPRLKAPSHWQPAVVMKFSEGFQRLIAKGCDPQAFA